MFVGFPEGAPLRRAATFTYNHVQAVRFLRTSYKAGPLVALGLAGLGALAVHALRPRLRGRGARRRGGAGGGRVLAAGARRRPGPPARPAPRRARGVARRRPRPRPHAAAAAGAPWSCPASSSPSTTGAGPTTRSCPALTDRPVATRFIVPVRRPARRRPAVDDRRAGQPAARAARASCGRCSTSWASAPCVQGADDDRSRSGAVPAASAAGGPARARRPTARAYGPPRTVPGAAGTLEPAARLPQVRRWNVPTGGMVRVLPRDGATVVDGSAQAHRRPRRLRRAADRPRAALRRRPRRGRAARPGGARGLVRDQRLQPPARLRRRAPARQHGLDRARRREALRGRRAARPVPAPRHRRADRRRSWAAAWRSVRADFSPGFAQFPERRPFAALDGDPSTAWLADRALATDRHHLDVALRGAARRRPRRPHALQRRPGPRGSRGRQRARVRGARRAGTGCRSGCAACAR